MGQRTEGRDQRSEIREFTSEIRLACHCRAPVKKISRAV